MDGSGVSYPPHTLTANLLCVIDRSVSRSLRKRWICVRVTLKVSFPRTAMAPLPFVWRDVLSGSSSFFLSFFAPSPRSFPLFHGSMTFRGLRILTHPHFSIREVTHSPNLFNNPLRDPNVLPSRYLLLYTTPYCIYKP